ncbi:MAG: hypothetical protein WAL95_17885, partial [Candidatus Acidiferrales bacterium]
MTPESKCLISLGHIRETTLIPVPAHSQKRRASPSQFLCISLLLLCALSGCASNAEKPAPPPPGVTVTPVVRKDVDIQQEWVGTMLGNIDA